MMEQTRLSQAQLLIAALFAVVLTGEMPETGLPVKGEIEPLDVEFRDVFDVPKQVRRRLVQASVTWIADTPAMYERRSIACKHLCKLHVMPSSIAWAVAEWIEEKHPSSGPTSIPTRWGWAEGPPTKAKTTQEWFDMRPKLSLHRGAISDVMRRFGTDPRFVPACWEQPEELDAAWHRCRAELLKIRAERNGGQA